MVFVLAELASGVGGSLDFYPALLYVGISTLLTCYLRKIQLRSAAVALAWVLRTTNALFLSASVLMLFFLLPINNRPDSSTAGAILVGGALVAGASLVWWAGHREISLALRERKMCNYRLQ